MELLEGMATLDAVELVLDAITRDDRTINADDLCCLADKLAERRHAVSARND
jgi:hypothetical protein